MAMSKWKPLAVFALVLNTLVVPASGQQQKPQQRKQAATSPTARTAKAPQEWKVLLIIKKSTNVKMEGLPPVEATIPADNIAAVKRAFTEFAPALVSELTNGRVKWDATAVESPYPLTRVTKYGDGSLVKPNDVREDYDRFVKPAQYDGVLFYWTGVDPRTGNDLKGGFGWTTDRHAGTGHAGHSCVQTAPTGSWLSKGGAYEIFVHEWLHQVEGHFGDLGIKLPKDGLHGAGHYGYSHNGHGRAGWSAWYGAFMNGTIREPDGSDSGLGERAWALGTIRDFAAVHTPQWLTPERRRRSLLTDASFEDGSAAWSPTSWRENTELSAIDRTVVKSGRQALRISIEAGSPFDIGRHRQTVTVKPGTRYLLAGWIKTRDVVDLEPKEGPISGAHLGIWGGFEVSNQLLGTSDWTYAALVFDSGERTSVEVSCSLGHWDAGGNGTAWFDDLILLELGPSKPGSAQPTTTPAGR